MGEQHLDLLAQPSRCPTFPGVSNGAGQIASPSWIERGTLRTGLFGQHVDFRAHPAQSCLVARYRIVASSFTSVPVVVSVLPPGQRYTSRS